LDQGRHDHQIQVKVSAPFTRNGNDRDVDRTTTVEIKDVGATKITLPKSKVSLVDFVAFMLARSHGLMRSNLSLGFHGVPATRATARYGDTVI